MKNVRGIIFDLDGVICFTDRYHYQAWKALADRIGVYFDETINHRLRGVSRMKSLDIILERSDKIYTAEEKQEMAEYKNEIYRELLFSMSPKDLPEEVAVTLEKLRQRGYLLAIGSSSKNARLILRQLGLEGYFDAVSDGTNITHSKPNPEVFLIAARMLELQPEECLVVEDAAAGIEAAIAGGFASAGIGEAAAYPKVTYPLERFSGLLELYPCDKTEVSKEV